MVKANINFIGRTEEQKALNDSLISSLNEFVAVYGRRRVGKTELIKHTLNKNIDFTFTGLYKKNQKTQLEYFYAELKKKKPNIAKKSFKNWREAFEELKEYLTSLKKEKVIVFLDELPWMDTHKGDFLDSLSYFWNMWSPNEQLLKLYVCGSSTTWMLNKLVGDKGGLYGRVNRKIYLAPFTLNETKQYLNQIKKANYNDNQVLDAYMIFGGIPFYLNMIDVSLPFSHNVDNLFFKIGGELRGEYDFLFRSLFKETINYQKVVNALSSKLIGLTRDEINKITSIEGGTLTEILKNLRACDFIRCYSFFGRDKKDKIYQLVDPFTLFYLKYVKDDEGQNEHFWTNNQGKPSINSWAGYAFEVVCFNHIDNIKKGLGISGINSSVHSWKVLKHTDRNGVEWPGAQIDLIIDRDDNVINIIEIKYSNTEYIITRDYYDHVNKRVENFRVTTETNKSTIITFITTDGLKQNDYSRNITSKLTLKQLIE